MSKIKRSGNEVVSEVTGQARPERATPKRKGLLLDDVMGAIRDVRQTYGLPEAEFGLEQIEREAGAKAAAKRIITDTLVQHAPEIYAEPDPIFDKICDIRQGKWLNSPPYSRWQIPPADAADVLRVVLERALQTIVQLPKKDPAMKAGTRELKLLALHYDRLAKEIADVFAIREIHHRAWTYFRRGNSQEFNQLLQQADELRRTAATIRAILANTRLVKQKGNSPNPQVRIALYLIGWFEASTGKKQYDHLKTLIGAAFSANGTSTPKWVERLEIEMTRRQARRKAWSAQYLSSLPFRSS